MKKDFLKKVMAAGLVASMALTTAACGSSDGSDATNGDATNSDASTNDVADTQTSDDAAVTDDGSYENCTLTISWWGDDKRQAATEAAIEQFEAAYPGIEVENQFAAWDGWETKMAANFMSGTEADVNQANWNWLTQYDNDGSVFLNLNDYSGVIDLTTIDEKYLDMCTTDGVLRGVPISMTGRLFYWDKTTFDEVGCDVPTTLEELKAAGAAFEAYGEDYYPLSLGEYDRMILMVYYLESVYGKDWVTDGALNYSAEEITEGLQFIQDLEDAHVIPTIATIAGDGADSLDKNPNWIDGHYAGIFEWDSSASKFATAAEGREIIVGDYLSDLGDYQGGYAKVSMCWTVKAKSEHPKEAALLVNYLLNNEEAAVTLASSRGIPCSSAALAAAESVLDAQTVEANGKVLSWVSNSLDTKFESSELKGNPDGVYYDVMAGLSYGDYTVEDAAQVLIDGIETVLAQ